MNTLATESLKIATPAPSKAKTDLETDSFIIFIKKFHYVILNKDILRSKNVAVKLK